MKNEKIASYCEKNSFLFFFDFLDFQAPGANFAPKFQKVVEQKLFVIKK
jgi:hypothetical protein